MDDKSLCIRIFVRENNSVGSMYLVYTSELHPSPYIFHYIYLPLKLTVSDGSHDDAWINSDD